MKEKIINKNNLKYILLSILVIIYIIAISPVGIQNDIFFDIKVGEKYITEGINTNDNFSIHENLKYVSHHFLVSVITYLVNIKFGFDGIYILEIMLTCILALFFYKVNNKYVKNKKISYALVFLELVLMKNFISTRAQMYSYILFLLEFIFIENILRNKGKRIYNILFLTLIPLFIVNFHAGTLPIYFIIIFVYLLNYININIGRIENEKEYISNLKYLFISIIGGLLLMFVNPFGIDTITYSFKTIGNSFINENIMEFQNSTITNNFLFYISLLVIVFSYFFTKTKIKIHQICFLLGSSFMTLLSLRHFSLFIIMCVTNLNIIEEIILCIGGYFYANSTDVKKQEKVLSIILITLVLIYSVYVYILRDKEYLPEDFYVLNGVEYLKKNINSDDRIFNYYNWGSFFMYNDIKPFIDSRADLYTEEYNEGCEVAKDYNDAIKCARDYNEIFEKYDIDYIFIPCDSNLYNNLLSNENYTQVYEDEMCGIFKTQN